MFPSPISFFKALRCAQNCQSTTSPPVSWSGSHMLQTTSLLVRSRESGAWVTDDCQAAQGCLFLDTFHLPQKKVEVSFYHSHLNFLCCIYLNLFLINSVTSDFICEKLYSSQGGLSYILITNNPQISMAQNNKGFLLTLSHDHA